ncbi:putative peroxidase [Mesorhizobium sp. 113-1-2]|uniref:peroxidase family protein n=1 Tax=Mesorhizobium sp. 113-1-2 TaxID=2744515 RepID=UPI0008198C2E|nr:peroxidase family protein [Mesorhizobium sp. 113-1-2]BAV45433.1 Peroxidase family protein [Mesorhizobium loti]BCG73323.1 putative peroxidase [Mesorhizobium sp. 113-1-2]
MPPQNVDVQSTRMANGSFNDLGEPAMGMAGTRFGRNFPINETFGAEGKALTKPSPREISKQLLARGEFVPVPHLNVLVSGWLQFMVHDWLSHGPNLREDPYRIPLENGDDWYEDPMTILRSSPDPAGPQDQGRPTAFANTETHWWDGSQIYGSTIERQMLVRTNPATGTVCPDGKLGLSATGNLPIMAPDRDIGDAEGGRFDKQELAGVTGNWWIGLSVFQTLFAREHNAIVDRLKIDHPERDGEWLFQKARLVNAALMAKIHTTEWTPALMNSPTGRFVMRTNWWGMTGEHFTRAFGRLSDNEAISGIMGSPTDHHAAPYAMTEEFVACYRMHSLIPDAFVFRAAKDDRVIFSTDMLGVSHGKTSGVYAEASFDDIVYSLATSHPGALVLHNFPNALRNLPINPEKGIFSDLAAIDILRDRERGVPRYCAFRRMLGMKVPASFDELTDNKEWASQVATIYERVEDVDLLVGTLCESNGGTPTGFGFSDTVFRIFILMASRRLKSDRFYTRDFTPDVYTPEGFAWVASNDLRSVMMRHCPALTPRFADVRNLYFPWATG